MNAPCYKCKDRKPLCHSSCDKYFEYKSMNELKLLKKYKENNVKDYHVKRVEKIEVGLKSNSNKKYYNRSCNK